MSENRIDSSRAAANRQAREERKAAWLRGIYDRYAAQFRAAAQQDALSLSHSLHGTISAVLAEERRKSADGGAITCGRGCSNCCREPVEIWPQEAALLLEAVSEAGVPLDRARLERQSRQTIESWPEQPAADTACVFLGADGACQVYESRPNACRKLLVLSDPRLCDSRKHPRAAVERWVSWEAELMETAALDVFGRGLLPALLLAALAAKR